MIIINEDYTKIRNNNFLITIHTYTHPYTHPTHITHPTTFLDVHIVLMSISDRLLEDDEIKNAVDKLLLIKKEKKKKKGLISRCLHQQTKHTTCRPADKERQDV